MESVNVLCFGDSLTGGYSQWGMSMTPYADSLEPCLQTSWPSARINVDVDGMSGDRVAGGYFLSRFRRQLKDPTHEKYDWIIILGGTNDLGHGLKPKDIFAGLEQIYEEAFDYGANVLALTVPECAAINKSLDERRDQLNMLIKNYDRDHFYTFDLYALMPYHNCDEESRDKIWDDGLHFTPHGYSVMGEHVANRLVELVKMRLEAAQDSEIKQVVKTQRAEA